MNTLECTWNRWIGCKAQSCKAESFRHASPWSRRSAEGRFLAIRQEKWFFYSLSFSLFENRICIGTSILNAKTHFSKRFSIQKFINIQNAHELRTGERLKCKTSWLRNISNFGLTDSFKALREPGDSVPVTGILQETPPRWPAIFSCFQSGLLGSLRHYSSITFPFSANYGRHHDK